MIHANTGYGEMVRLYRAAGWPSVLPLPPGQKMPPPSGFTGHQAPDPTEAQMDAWAAQRPDANVALRMPSGVMALDTDAYGEKKGGLTLAAAERQWGPLPPTWRSTSRPDDAVSGIRYFRVPPGTVLPGTLEMGANGTRTGDIEIIQRHHRFAVVAPSLHPQQRRYVWFRPDGTQAAEGQVPCPEQLPDLPQTWLTGLLAQRSGGDPTALLEALPTGEPCTKMQEFRRKALDSCQGGSRHDNVKNRLLAIVRLGEQGHPGAPAVLQELRAAFVKAVAGDRQGGEQEAQGEFDRMVHGGARIIAAQATPELARGCSCGLVPDSGMSDAHLTDVVTAEVLLGRWLWSEPLGWLRWDGRRWQLAPPPLVHDAVRRYLKSTYHDARERAAKLTARIEELEAHRGLAKVNGNGSGASTMHEIEELVQHRAEAEQEAKQWYATLARPRIVAISDLTRGTVTRDTTEFDARPDLLNVENGVIDLTTGSLKPHDPDLLLIRMAPVAYRPGARHSDWDKALTAVPEDVCDWYQERLGQAITGHIPPDDLLIIQVGTGENGKTTLMSGVQAVLGDYFVLASERVLIADPTAHPTELMDLRGARLALIEETPEERRLSISRLKKVVGNPTITARRMRQDSVTFPATHALFVSTNYQPIVEETDHGTWRRLACLRFPYLFRKAGQPLTGPNDRPGDDGLRQRLKEGRGEQHQAILAWLVKGAQRWYARGGRMPLPPARVQQDTRDWQRYSDLFLAYVEEHLVYDVERHVMSRGLLAHFNAWLTERGHRPWSDRTFNKRLEEHHEMAAHQVVKKVVWLDASKLSRPPGDFGVVSSNQYTAWLGLRYRTDVDPSGDPEDDDGGSSPTPISHDGGGPSGRPTSLRGDPNKPSHPSHESPAAIIWSAGPNDGVAQTSLHTLHNDPPANSKGPDVKAVKAFQVDAVNGSALARVRGYPNNPSQPSQAGQAQTTAGDAAGPVELPADASDAEASSGGRPPDDDPIVEWVL